MAKYDPDANPDDFDPTDLEMVQGYLDDPGTIRMHDSLAEAFRHSPPADQVETLAAVLAGAMRMRDRIARSVDSGASLEDEGGALVRELFEAKRDEVQRLVARIASLSKQTGPLETDDD